MRMYSIFDQKAEVFLQPVFFRAHGEAMRQLETELRNPESMMGAHPEDFVLFHVADFDVDTGVLSVVEPPLVLSRASDLIPRQNGSEAD